MTVKYCGKCRTDKPLDDFSKDRRRDDGHCRYCRQCVKHHYRAGTAYMTEAMRRWRLDNKAHLSAYRCDKSERLKEVRDGTVTAEFLRTLYAQETCTYCKKFTPKEKRTADHVKPVAKGGLHTASNLVMACSLCNSTKNDTDVEVFIRRLECT